MKATIRDIAEMASVSTATVDRVLNGRAGVKLTNRYRVLQAADKLGYLPKTDTLSMPSRPAQLEFVLPVGTNHFLAKLADHIEDFCSRLPLVSVCRLHRLETTHSGELLEALDRLDIETAGVGVVAVEDPRSCAAISRLTEAGLRVVTVVSDLPTTSRANYVGIDNRIAGRTVGKLLGHMLNSHAQDVALFLGSHKYRGHEEREAGFRSVLSEEFTNVSVSEVAETDDDTKKGYASAQSILARNTKIGAVYCAGGGRSGVIRAVREQFHNTDRPLVVCHDLTEDTKEALLDGSIDIVIDQNARLIAEQATIQLLGTLASFAPFLTKKLVEPRIITRENIPLT